MEREIRYLQKAIIGWLFLFMVFAPLSVVAQTAPAGDNISWELTEDGVLHLNGSGPMSNYVSPENVPWFADKEKIKEIEIADGITEIANYAFWSCSQLNSIHFPDSVEKIGQDALYHTGLVRISIPKKITAIPARLCQGCENLERVSLPEGVKKIGTCAFYECKKLEDVNLPEGLQIIEGGAFNYCNFTSVDLPRSLTSAYGGFNQCPNLKKASIYDTVQLNLEQFPITQEDFTLSLTVTGEKVFTSGSNVPWRACPSLKKVTFEDTVKQVSPYLLISCSGVTEITLPNGVETIGDFAFSGCDGIRDLTIPNSVKSIGKHALAQCTGMKELILSENLTEIPEFLCQNCSNLETVTIPDSVKTMKEHAFGDCAGLKSIRLPADLEVIPDRLCYGCTNLESVNLPNGLKSIGVTAFSGCKKLTQITFPEGLREIAGGAFYQCTGLTEIELPRSLSQASGAFANCSNLKSVHIYDLLNINLEQFPIKEEDFTLSLTVTGEKIFASGDDVPWKSCSALKQVTFEDTVKQVSPYLLMSCSGVTEITLPNGLETIGDYAFARCEGIRDITIPDSVKTIKAHAFGECSGLKSIKLPAELEAIPDRLCYNCSNLESVTMPEGLKSIGLVAFSGCEKLTQIGFPEGLREIAGGAFYQCKGLTEIELPRSLITAYGAFSECTNIKTVHMYDLASLSINMFPIKEQDFSLYVTITGEKNFTISGDVPWISYEKPFHITFEKGIERISPYLFIGCSGLTEITIPESVKTIGASAFQGCSGLTEITIPKNVNSIGKQAFDGCDALDTFTFDMTDLPNISQDALSDQVATVYYPSTWEEDPSSTAYGAKNVTWILYEKDGVHRWDDGHVTRESTCGETGIRLYTCTLCKEATKEESIAKTNDHSWNDGVITKLPQCNQKGTMTYTCTVCHGQKEEAIAEDPNHHNWYYRDITKEANCTEEGEKRYTCLWCNKDRMENIPVDAEAHVWDEGLWDASEENITYTCELCKKTRSEFHARPKKLASLVAVGDVHAISLSWSMAYEAETAIYHIYRKAETENAFRLLAKIEGRKSCSYKDTDVITEKAYEYYVVGVNEYGKEGDACDATLAYALKDTENPIVTKLTPANGSVLSGVKTIAMTSEDNVEVIKAEIALSMDDGASWEILSSSDDSKCSVEFHSDQYQNGKIKVRAMAYDATGNASDGIIYNYRIDNQGPEKVSGLSHESSSTVITLKWSDVSDADFSFFRVEEKDAQGHFQTVMDVSKTLGCNITGLKPEETHTYRVVAYDLYGNRGEASEEYTCSSAEDVTVPVISKILPAASYYRQEIPLKITAQDDTSICSLTIQTSTNSVSWDDIKTYEYDGNKKTVTQEHTLNLSSYAEGKLYVRAIAEDRYKNVSDETSDAPFVQYFVDKHAPETPQQPEVNTTAGAIEIHWSMGQEEDIDSYDLYRSENGLTYALLAEKLKSINYWDRSVERGKKYYYKLKVRDLAGNESGYSDTVSAELSQDTEAPEIKSCAPASGDTVGVDTEFALLVSDNDKLASVVIEYKINDATEYQRLHADQGIASYYKRYQLSLPVDQCKDQDTIYVRVCMTDEQGLETISNDYIYHVDKVSPSISQINVTKENDGIKLSWTGNTEEDFAGYEIYRKTDQGAYQLIGSHAAASQAEYYFEDDSVEEGHSYQYKVQAYDTVGNYGEAESTSVGYAIPEKKEVFAEIDTDLTQMAKKEYVFDGSSSSSSSATITSWEYDFGDGVSLRSETGKVKHVYEEAGTYELTLTVTDQNGQKDVRKENIVVEEESLLGTVTVTLYSSDGGSLSGKPIYFDMEQSSRNIKYTNASGKATFSAKAGAYVVGSYVDGYRPETRKIVVQANSNTEVSLTLVKDPIVKGEFEVNRMTLDEIKAAGINIADPANQQVMRLTIHLEYGTVPLQMDMITNGNQILRGGSKTFNTSTGVRKIKAQCVELKQPKGQEHDDGNVLIALIDVPVEASCLKEFFDVKLHIINQASAEYNLTNNKIHLNLPDGLSLMDAKGASNSLDVNIPLIKGQTQESVQWILRGDEAGQYDLSADYSGILSKFTTIVHARFETESPIEVYGLKGLKILAEVESTVRDDAFYMNLSLVNNRSSDIYMPKIDIWNEIITVYRNKKKENSDDEYYLETDALPVRLLNVTLSDQNNFSKAIGNAASINTLNAGYKLTKQYMVFNLADKGPANISYFRDAVAYIGNQLDLDVEIISSNFNHYSMEDYRGKISDILTDPNKRSSYDYVMDSNGKHFMYENQATANAENFLNTIAEGAVDLNKLVFDGNDDYKEEEIRGYTREFVVQMLQDESTFYAINVKIESKYFKVTQSILNNLVGALSSSKDYMAVVPNSDDELNSIKAVLSEASNIRTLQKELKIGDQESFKGRTISLLASMGISTAARKVVETTFYDYYDTLAKDAFARELGSVAGLFNTVNSAFATWNQEMAIVNQLLTIAATQEESVKLFDMLLSSDALNSDMRKEIEYLKRNVVDGYAKIGVEFSNRLQKDMIRTEVNKVKNQVLTCLAVVYGNPVAIIYKVTQLFVNSVDYLLGISTKVSQQRKLMVISVLSQCLKDAVKKYPLDEAMTEEEMIYHLVALKYLIKSRLLGEEYFLALMDSQEKSDQAKVLKGINERFDSSYDSCKEYGQSVVNQLVGHRDSLFSTYYETLNVAPAPAVTIDYRTEATKESFSDKYEYSFDGNSWSPCDGNPIQIKPGTIVDKHLWVRLRATEKEPAGNVKKIVIPIRPHITEHATARQNGEICKIYGLSAHTFEYAFLDSQEETFRAQGNLVGEEDYKRTSRVEDKTYLALRVPAGASSFASNIYYVIPQKVYKLLVNYDFAQGSVDYEEEYPAGSMPRIKASPREGYHFAGWYQGDNYIGNNVNHTFTMEEETVLEARFETHTYGDWIYDEKTGTHSRRCICNQAMQKENCSYTMTQSEANCQEEGQVTYTCSICGGKYNETVPKTDHQYENDICIFCHKVKTINDGGLIYEVIPGADFQIDGTVKGKVRVIGLAEEDGISKDGELAIPEYANEMATTTYGYHYVVKGYLVVEIAPHAFENLSNLKLVKIPPSVTSIGESAFTNCRNLAEVFFKGANPPEVASSAFKNISPAVKITAPEYKEDMSNLLGYHVHQPVVDPKKDADCVHTGLTEGKHCSACGAILLAQTKIPAQGHKWSAYKVTKEATVLAAGIKKASCTKCGASKQLAISKLKPTIKLSATKKTIKLKKKYLLKITNLAKGDGIQSIKISNKKVVSVKKYKKNQYFVRGLKKGKAKITIVLKSNKKAVFTVTIK